MRAKQCAIVLATDTKRDTLLVIKNNRQLKYVKRILRQLKQGLDATRKKYSSNKDKAALLSRGYVEHITQLEGEIEERKRRK